MQELKKCHFCQKDTKKEMLYRTDIKKNYKYTYLCYRCNAYKNRGCKFNYDLKKWIGKRKPVKIIYKPIIRLNVKRESEHEDCLKKNISYAKMFDYLD